jgi:uncharacterized protein (DUF433 family)
MMAPLFISDPNVLNGTSCFAGTNVPVQSLFDYLFDGATVGSFVADFPGISWEQIEGALEERSEGEMDCLPRLQAAHRSAMDYLDEN